MKKLIIITFLLFSFYSYTQNVNTKSYKWKYRLVLIVSEGKENILYSKQLNELLDSAKAFEERKLKIIDIQPNKVREISYLNNQIIIEPWQKNTELYRKYKSKKSNFKVLLIGLDGGIKKVIQQKFFPKKLLFTLIDGMPMRRTELKRN